MTELEHSIIEASQAYYEGNKIISDYEFDKLIDRLKIENPSSELLSKTGWGYVPNPGQSLEHEFKPIGGIPISLKPKTSEELLNALSYLKVKENTKIIATPKLDGGSVTLYYSYGKLTKAISRGNGEVGIDVTNTMLQLSTVPKYLKLDTRMTWKTYAVRGEIVLPVNNSLGIITMRNSAVGISQTFNRDLDEVECEEYMFVAYNILRDTMPSIQDSTYELVELEVLGFLTPKHYIFEDLSYVSKFTDAGLENIVKTLAEIEVKGKKYTLPVDGMVLNIKDTYHMEDGFNYYQYDRVAYKVESEAVETTVEDIVWQYNATGKLTPVLKITPVFIDQAEVSSPTGNSYSWLVNDYKCGVGAKVMLVRSGGVIPKIIDVLVESTDYKIPTVCEHCNSLLEVQGAHLYCPNQACSYKFATQLSKLILWHSPKGIGEAALEEFFEEEKLESMEDFITFLTANDRVEGYKDSQYVHHQKLYEAFVRIRELNNVEDILFFSGIPGLGEANLDKILESMNQIGEWKLYFQGYIPLDNITGYDNLTERWQELLLKYEDMIKTMYEIGKTCKSELTLHPIKEVDEDQKESRDGLPKVCLTNLSGSPMKKREIEEKFTNFQFVDYVDETVKYVVYFREGSSKHQRALDLGIECLTVDAFIANN